MTTAIKQRPKYLNLLKIRQPIPAVVSILHRISGVGLFLLGIPLALYILQSSLSSEAGFDQLKRCLSYPLIKLICFGLIWAFFHHLLAGIRFLLLDIHAGISLAGTRTSSKIVIVVSLLLTLFVFIKIW